MPTDSFHEVAGTTTAPGRHTARPPSDYADRMPLLHEFAALHPDDPRREDLRRELILAFRPVVEHMARRHSASRHDCREDLEQVGTMALINAIDRWDPARARGEFLGYLIPCVRGEMLRWFRDRAWSVRVPRRLKDVGVAINRVTGDLTQELGRTPRPSDLATCLGISVDEILEALDAMANLRTRRLDAADSETGSTLADQLGECDDELDKVEYRQALRPLLDALPERERTIVVLRFFGDLTQTQIAEEIGISQMHVSRLLTRTLATLRSGLTGEQDRAGRSGCGTTAVE